MELEGSGERCNGKGQEDEREVEVSTHTHTHTLSMHVHSPHYRHGSAHDPLHGSCRPLVSNASFHDVYVLFTGWRGGPCECDCGRHCAGT